MKNSTQRVGSVRLIFQNTDEDPELGNEIWNTGFLPAISGKTIKSVSIDLALMRVQIYFPEQLEYETVGNIRIRIGAGKLHNKITLKR